MNTDIIFDTFFSSGGKYFDFIDISITNRTGNASI